MDMKDLLKLAALGVAGYLVYTNRDKLLAMLKPVQSPQLVTTPATYSDVSPSYTPSATSGSVERPVMFA